MTEFKKAGGSCQILGKAEAPSKDSASSISNVAPLDKMCTAGNSVLNAEILWALKCVQSHFSYSSCKDTSEIFAAMFPDSVIARQFSCGESKCSYLCHFGLAPHFRMLLFKCLDDVKSYTLLFDESLNQCNQQKQLDIHIRFWHPTENKVRTQYLNSAFLGHSTANDLLLAFYKSVEKLDLSKLVQVSMDGPAVNWKFYQSLQEDLIKEHNVKCISIGSCGLHILNNAFWKGEACTEWNIGSILSALYYLFKDCPARREDFLNSSVQKKLPLKFCSHRWLENAPVAERAILVWDDVISYTNKVQSGKHSKVTCKSYFTVLEATRDCLFVVKLNFFRSVTELLCPFLELYQADKPLLPFFSGDIHKLIKHFIQLFNIVKAEHLEKFSSLEKLCHIDFDNESLFSLSSKVSIGFKGDKLLKELVSKKVVTDQQNISLKSDCKKFIIKLLRSIMEKCPVNYSVVRNSACIDPRLMASNGNKCLTKMKSILNYLAQKKKVEENDCDEINLQFSDFLDSVVKENSVQFSLFDPRTCDLDTFLSPYFDDKFSKLWGILKLLMILSHGQASVERGFSINKKVEVENRKNNSYIAQRVIYDHIKHVGGILKVDISKELLISASTARLKYRNYLEEQKTLREKSEHKRKLEEEISFLKQKKMCLVKDVEETENLIENLANEAEAKKDINLFIKSNKLRKTVSKTKEEIDTVNKELSKLGQ
ncbi:hypothetical protein AVEN_22110-1 [Araneus ventricosus]|uniref:Uncharacterized protein n=1 Tax=Araneus ventricosus TaxID=182803 RepID=A0A4Y2B785_ARAVE|nr:hypothetical protein AVEN_22110-1 [Araneus ventricosus]